MLNRKTTPSIVAIFALLATVLFCSTSFAAITGTDSKGSYSYDAGKKEDGSVTKKGEGSGSKASPHKNGYIHGKKGGSHHLSPHKKPHGYTHGKKEGSGNKSYAHSKHGYTHKGKEGSGSHKNPHGSPYHKFHSAHKASGHGSAHGSGKSPFEHVLCFTKKLGLTEKQVNNIKAHEFEFKKMKIQSDAAHSIAHMELDRLAHSETLDEAGMRAIADRISEIKSINIHAMIEAKIVILKILTPEQRQKVSKIHAKK